MASSTKVDLCRLTASTSSGAGTTTMSAATSNGLNGLHIDQPSTSAALHSSTISSTPSSSTNPSPSINLIKSESIPSDDERAPTLHRETDLNYDTDSNKSPYMKTDSGVPTPSDDLHPEEYLNKEWNIEKVSYYSSNSFNAVTSRLTDALSSHAFDSKKMRQGFAYSTRDKEEFKCFCDENRTFYRIGDYAYLEMENNAPYVVGKIDSFKMKKTASKCTMQVKITKLYRRDELVPDSIYLLEQERQDGGVVENNSNLKCRELFPSDSTSTTSVGCLKGLCSVLDMTIQDAYKDGMEDEDSFFFCTTYSADTGRIAPFHPMIREGNYYQAEIPPFVAAVANDVDRDQLLYKPGQISRENEELVVNAAITYRTKASENAGKMNDIEKKMFLGDCVKNDTCEMLHQCNYNSQPTLNKCMEQDRVFLDNKLFMSSEDCKKFTKGLRNYGKNFHKIHKELFAPNYSRGELVHYFYYWKKTDDAFKPKNQNRNKPMFAPSKRTTRNGTSTPTPVDSILIDYDSLSEDEECDLNRACHHCYSSVSRDWHHSGPERQLLCTLCRHHYKKYGSMRYVEGKPDRPPPSLCREQTPTSNEDEDGVKTRAGRANRHRTPIDLLEKTPCRSVESEPERRTTPQRSVKIRKRSYNVSTSSLDENLTPKKHKEKLIKAEKIKQEKPSEDLPPVLENEAKRDAELRETSSSRTSSCEDSESVNKRKNGRCGLEDNEVVNQNQPQIQNSVKIEAPDSDDEFKYEPLKMDHKISRDYCKLKRNSDCENDSASCARTQIFMLVEQETDWQKKRVEREARKEQQRIQKEEEAKKQAQLQNTVTPNALQGLANLAGGSIPNTPARIITSMATPDVNSMLGIQALSNQALAQPNLSVPNLLNNGGIMQTGQGLVTMPRPDQLLQMRTATPSLNQRPPTNINELITMQNQLHNQQQLQNYQRQWATLAGQGMLPQNLLTQQLNMGMQMNPQQLANPQILQQLQAHAFQQNQLREMEERKRQQQLEREQRERREREQREQRERQQQEQQQHQQQQQQQLFQQLLMSGGMTPQTILGLQMQNAQAAALLNAQALQNLNQTQQPNINQQLEMFMRAQQQQQQAHQLNNINPQMAALLQQQQQRSIPSSLPPTVQNPLASLSGMASLAGLPTSTSSSSADMNMSQMMLLRQLFAQQQAMGQQQQKQ